MKKTPGRSGSLPNINKFSIILFFLYKLQFSFDDQFIERKFPLINDIYPTFPNFKHHIFKLGD